MSTNQPSSQELQTLRAKADEIGQRVRSDPQFVKRLVNDPKTTLQAEGFPAEAINEVIGQPNQPGVSSCFWSCWATTGCCWTIKVCCSTGSC